MPKSTEPNGNVTQTEPSIEQSHNTDTNGYQSPASTVIASPRSVHSVYSDRSDNSNSWVEDVSDGEEETLDEILAQVRARFQERYQKKAHSEDTGRYI